jgi:hypothetical protein
MKVFTLSKHWYKFSCPRIQLEKSFHSCFGWDSEVKE